MPFVAAINVDREAMNVDREADGCAYRLCGPNVVPMEIAEPGD